MSNAEQTEFGQGTLEHLDPNALETDGNVRDDPALTRQFIASIKENGVLVPITAVRTTDGAVRVRTGQRRTLAAREAGLPTIPVYVIGEGFEDTTRRTIEQLVENDHRSTLTQVQRVHGIQQLLDVGLSPTKVAKSLSVSKQRVADSQAVAASPAAIDALAQGQLTLTEAAVLAEFEGDEGATERLLRCAGTRNFEYTVEQLRQERDDVKALREAEQQWRDKGFTVLDERPTWTWDPDCVEWGFLLKDGRELTEADIVDPKHWAVLLWEETMLTNTETGEEVGEDQVDWDTQDDPDAAPKEGKLHADKVTETEAFVPEFYYCLDVAGAGLTVNERFARYSGQAAQGFPEGGNSDSADTVDRTDDIGPVYDDKAEAEKRERRKVLALNKLGDAALTVRQQFVTNLLSRKTSPKGAAIFVARFLSGDPHLLSDYKADEITAALLGAEHVEGSGYQYQIGKVTRGVAKLVEALPDNGDSRAQVITLGLVLGALESRTPKDAWRKDKWAKDRSLKPYLEFLVANGYELSPIEEVMTGTRKPDKVYDAYLKEQ